MGSAEQIIMATNARDRGAGEPATRVCGAGEPAALTVLLAMVEVQVVQTEERDTVLDTGKQLEGKMIII